MVGCWYYRETKLQNTITMQHALEGIRVLDFSQLLQGPFATQMLGDLGADVVKIEKVGTGDLYRSLTFFNEWIGDNESPLFLAWNRNKRSLAIDIKSEQGREVIRKLAEKADVVIENFRPGVLDRLGYGYEDLKAINPRIIYCSASGWGTSGPYLSRPGQDMLVQAVTGAVFSSGKKSDGPVALGCALSDQASAMHIVYGTLAALFHRERTGEGQKVEVNLLQSTLSFLAQDYFTVQNLGRDFERPESGIAHPGNGAPFGIYETANGHIAIAMNHYPKLVEALGEPDLLRFQDPQTLYDRRDEVFYAIEAVTKTKTTEEWLKIMLDYDLWVAPTNQLKDVANDPQVRHLGAFIEIEHPKAGKVRVTNVPIHMSKTPGSIDRPAPLVGQHSREILKELGYSTGAIEAMFVEQCISEDLPPVLAPA